MPVLVTLLGLVLLSWFAAGQQAETMQKPSARAEHLAGEHLGFDRNDYPGDAALATLR
jgi:hypothetical protein